MKYITDFFSALGEIIQSIIHLVIDLFTALVEFFLQVPEYVDIIESYIDLIPEPLIAIALMALAAQLIFIIIGSRGV